MKTDLNTLLTTLYVHLDDRILPALGFSRDHHSGHKPVLSDVELLCLIVAQHLLGIASERKWIRYADSGHPAMSDLYPVTAARAAQYGFPRTPEQRPVP